MKIEFEKKLKENGYSYQPHSDDLYILTSNDDERLNLKVQLISAEPTVEVIRQSRNGNKLQAVGSFKVNLMSMLKGNDLLIFTFENTINPCVEFIIIPSKEFERRLIESYRLSKDNQVLSIVFWLMADCNLYETTDFGIEWEWYFLSKGKNGRIIDHTDLDYSEFLNNWGILNKI